jgi:transposase
MIARWTNTSSGWRRAAVGCGSAGRPCAALCGGSGCGAKKTLRASAQDRADIREERAVFCERIRQIEPQDLVFGDETGITAAMTRLHARAPRNEPARGAAPCGHWRRLTVPGALSGEGVVAAMSLAAATTTKVFLAFPRAVLVPGLRRPHPGATVPRDNLSAHQPRAIETTLTEAGLKLLSPPRHSPDLSPIEPGWSKLKSAWRTTAARTPDALDAALAPALDSITPADARGWFNHCGYPFPN